MGAVVTAKSGYDISYPVRGLSRGAERSVGGYYANAAQAERAVYGCDGELVEVDLGAACEHPGERPAGPAGRPRAGGGVVGGAGAQVQRGPPGREFGGAAAPGDLGWDDPDRVARGAGRR